MGLPFLDSNHHLLTRLRPRELTRTQRNDVLREIQQLDLDPADFAWGFVMARSGMQKAVAAVEHRPTGCYFIFDLNAEAGPIFLAHGSPQTATPELLSISFPTGSGIEGAAKQFNWDEQLGTCCAWLALVEKEAAEPDLWAGVAGADRFPGVDPAAGDEPFTEEEQKRVTACVDEVEEYLVEASDVVAAKRAEFKPMFDYLRGAVKRMSRRDWTLTFVGALMNVAMEAALDGYGFKALFKFAGQQLQLALGSVGAAIGAAATKLLEGP